MAAIVLAVVVAACGGGSLPPAYRVTYAYLGELSVGNYRAACGHLDREARVSLGRSGGQRSSCVYVLKRCGPDRALDTRRDPTQLQFANVAVTIKPSSAVARLNGTVIADAIRRVALVKQGRRWLLSSYGEHLIRCGHNAPRRVGG